MAFEVDRVRVAWTVKGGRSVTYVGMQGFEEDNTWL